MNKVLLIDTGRKWGGGQRQTYLLQKYLIRNGISSVTVTPENSVLYKKLQNENFESVALPNFFTAYNPATYCRIISKIKKDNTGILYTQTSNAHTIGLLVKFFLRKLKLYVARRVIRPAGRGFTGRIKYNSRLVDKYIAVSEFSAGVLRDSDIPAEKIAVVHDGIELDVLQADKNTADFKKEFGIPDNALIVGTVGALDKIKDQITFLKAIRYILEKTKRDDLYFVIVGSGNLRKELEDFARQQGIYGKKVIFTGFRFDVFDIVSSFFLFVLSSKSENFCNATLEALAMGVPVITTKVGGVPEQIDEGKNGFFINVGDSGMLSEKILYFIDNPEKRQEMSLYARKSAERFSIQKTIKEVIRIFDGG
ncbi:MAG: glycosyltransferase family 4 protein [Elusimicrobia bacterium]|nr:glycosyltransferase family 4 protein [Elusimicrobiota bacterium]